MLFDVYVKKLLIEKILDNIVLDEEKEKAKTKQKPDKKNKTKE